VYSSSGIHKSRLSSLRFPDLCWLISGSQKLYVRLGINFQFLSVCFLIWLGSGDFFRNGWELMTSLSVWFFRFVSVFGPRGSLWPFPATFIVLLYVYFVVYISSKLGCNISISFFYCCCFPVGSLFCAQLGHCFYQ